MNIVRNIRQHFPILFAIPVVLFCFCSLSYTGLAQPGGNCDNIDNNCYNVPWQDYLDTMTIQVAGHPPCAIYVHYKVKYCPNGNSEIVVQQIFPDYTNLSPVCDWVRDLWTNVPPDNALFNKVIAAAGQGAMDRTFSDIPGSRVFYNCPSATKQYKLIRGACEFVGIKIGPVIRHPGGFIHSTLDMLNNPYILDTNLLPINTAGHRVYPDGSELIYVETGTAYRCGLSCCIQTYDLCWQYSLSNGIPNWTIQRTLMSVSTPNPPQCDPENDRGEFLRYTSCLPTCDELQNPVQHHDNTPLIGRNQNTSPHQDYSQQTRSTMQTHESQPSMPK